MRTDLTPKELADRLASGQTLRIVDVRSPEEFRACHVRGAVNIPLETIHGTLPGFAPEEPVAIVCKSGMRSSTACGRIAANHPTAYNLVGGTDAWKEAGLPTEASPKSAWSPDGQTHLIAGLLVLTGVTLSLTVNPWWIVMSVMPGFGLILYGTTGICPMTLFLKRMPWNRPRTCQVQ